MPNEREFFMAKLFFLCKNGFVRTKQVAIFLCAALYLLLIILSGGTVAQLALFWACLLVYLLLPGFLFVQLFKFDSIVPGAGTPFAIVCGTGFLVVLYCFAMRLGLLWALYILPPLCSLLWFVLFCPPLKEKAAGLQAALQNGTTLCLVLAVAVISVLFAFYISVKTARPGLAGAISLHPDVLWNIGNANSFAIAFPPQDIRFSLVRLSYHYLTEMTEGVLAMVSGISAYNIVAFYAGPAVAAAMVTCLYALGKEYYGSENKALLFVLPFPPAPAFLAT